MAYKDSSERARAIHEVTRLHGRMIGKRCHCPVSSTAIIARHERSTCHSRHELTRAVYGEHNRMLSVQQVTCHEAEGSAGEECRCKHPANSAVPTQMLVAIRRQRSTITTLSPGLHLLLAHLSASGDGRALPLVAQPVDECQERRWIQEDRQAVPGQG